MKRTSMRRFFGSATATALALFSIHPPTQLYAQGHNKVPLNMESLSPAQRDTLERLKSFGQLQEEEWSFHTGDIAHGESVSLDDSSWSKVKPKTEVTEDASWFRRWIEIPKTIHGYDPTGARIWFRFQVDSDEDVPQIIYLNGRRVALGEDLEPILLTESAKPGERILVAVKLLQTAHKKSYKRVTLNIDFADGRPNPEDLRLEILSAETLLPAISKNLASDRKVVSDAIDAIDLHALDANQTEQFDASLRSAQQKLSVLKPELQKLTFHETGNSHIDAAWLWPWTETVDVVHRTFSSAAQLMNEYPQYTYTQSAAQYNEWVAEKYPELNDEIKRRIKEGRWEIVGGMWVEPDLNMPDGESVARSILLGKRYYQKEYGVNVHIGWNPDTFGYNWQLPQIYKRSGIDTFVTQKMAWNDTNQLPLKLFWWQAPDGSKVLTYFPNNYGNRTLEPTRLSQEMVKTLKQAPGLTEMMDLYGVGDHGGGPTRSMLDQGMHWSEPDKIAPKMTFGTADSYFKSIAGKISSDSTTWNYEGIGKGYQYPAAPSEGKINIPTWNDELYLEYHRGVFTTQTGHKLGMRTSEEQTLNAEKVASLAWLQGLTYPNDALTEAWKKIAFNGFHDLAAGSGIGVIYKDSHEDFEKVRLITNEVTEKSENVLDAQVDTRVKGDVPVIVRNPLAWERNGSVEAEIQLPAASDSIAILDEKDKVVPSTILEHDANTNRFKVRIDVEHVPSLGYTVLHAVASKKDFSSDLKQTDTTLENAHLKVVLDPKTGCITSLYDKDHKTEALAASACGNELQAFTDKPKDYDAWNIDPGTLDKAPTLLTAGAAVTRAENTPLSVGIRVEHKWQSSTFTQTVHLDRDANFVRIDTDVDWHEKHILLKAAFPLSHSSAHATYEIPYGSIQRPTTRNNSWEKARFEVPALRWADLGDNQFGLSLINNSKYGYDSVGNVLRISLLRSPTSPDPVADQGIQHISFLLYPHAGTWEQAGTVQQGYDFNYPLTAHQTTAHSGTLPKEMSYIKTDTSDVIITAVKKAEDSNAIIIRMYEDAGKPSDVHLTVPKGVTSAESVSIMENTPDTDAHVSLQGETASFSIHPYQIVTIKLNYPEPKQQ